MDPGDVWREMDGIWMVNGLTLCELENGPVEIVSFPSYKIVIIDDYTWLRMVFLWFS
jgi:hypothetical protein